MENFKKSMTTRT
jgi:solute carrier family 25 oxoglutarate transporter 11